MSQTSKIILIAIGAAIIGGGSVYLWQTNILLESPPISIQERTESKAVSSSSEGAVKYNCELSGGSFKNGNCDCPIEEGLDQTQDMMYDKNTDFCQTTYGGPGGDAFAASVGLPYGNYAFYNDIVQNNCKETGGEFLYACNCTEGKSYDKTTGYCE